VKKILAITALLVILAAPQLLQAQYYVWIDTLAITTATVDSAFLYRWEECTLRARGCAIYFKVGSPDTSCWSVRKWYYLAEGESVEFGFRTPLNRIAMKAASGSGIIYLAGYKRRSQYQD